MPVGGARAFPKEVAEYRGFHRARRINMLREINSPDQESGNLLLAVDALSAGKLGKSLSGDGPPPTLSMDFRGESRGTAASASRFTRLVFAVFLPGRNTVIRLVFRCLIHSDESNRRINFSIGGLRYVQPDNS